MQSGRLRVADACALIGLRRRQVFRLLRGVKQNGAVHRLSRHRRKPSNHRLPAEVRTLALSLVRDRYPDFGPTLEAEKLARQHGCSISRETLRGWMSGRRPAKMVHSRTVPSARPSIPAWVSRMKTPPFHSMALCLRGSCGYGTASSGRNAGRGTRAKRRPDSTQMIDLGAQGQCEAGAITIAHHIVPTNTTKRGGTGTNRIASRNELDFSGYFICC